MGLSYEEDNSRSERLKRAITNPSKRTILIAVVIGLIALSPGMVKVFYTAQEGIGSITAEHDLTTNMSSVYEDIDNLEDEYVAPYLVEQSTVMLNATGPLEWEIGNYRFGVCAQEAIGKMADAVYAETIDQACNELYDIQGRYARNCYIAATCNVSDESKDELRKVIDQLWTAHSTAGYTRPNP